MKMKIDLVCDDRTPKEFLKGYLKTTSLDGYNIVRISKNQPKGKYGRRGFVKIEYYFIVKDSKIIYQGNYIGQCCFIGLFKEWDSIYDTLLDSEWHSLLSTFDRNVERCEKNAHEWGWQMLHIDENDRGYNYYDTYVGDKQSIERQYNKAEKAFKKAVDERNKIWRIYREWKQWRSECQK